MAKPKFTWFPTCYMPDHSDRHVNPDPDAYDNKRRREPDWKPDINGDGHWSSFVIAFNQEEADKMIQMRGLGEYHAKWDSETPWQKKYHCPRTITKDTQSTSYWRLLSNRLGTRDYAYGATSHYWRLEPLIKVALYTKTFTWEHLFNGYNLFSPGVANRGFNQKMVDFVKNIETALPGFTVEYAEKFHAGTV